MRADWDAIVVGAGGVGSAALAHLARRGLRVLGIEQHDRGHALGSSHGESRAIRLAYFEHPAYVPLLRRAYALWSELEAATGQRLYTASGVLQIGPPDGEVLQGVRRSAQTHGLSVEPLSAGAVEERFPGFRVPAGMAGLLEAEAGHLAVEACVRAHLDQAEAHGATCWHGAPVRGWRVEPDGVWVRTPRGEATARRLVLATGAWADLPGLTVRRKTQHWLTPAAPGACAGAPVYLYELPEGIFYGFPPLGGAMKAAEHTGGEVVADPSAVDRMVRGADRAPVQGFLRRWLPGVDAGAIQRETVCMYTMTPDGHFAVGPHPRHPAVVVAAGLSGHGFKFAPVLGEALADLVERGQTDHPIAPFDPARLR